MLIFCLWFVRVHNWESFHEENSMNFPYNLSAFCICTHLISSWKLFFIFSFPFNSERTLFMINFYMMHSNWITLLNPMLSSSLFIFIKHLTSHMWIFHHFVQNLLYSCNILELRTLVSSFLSFFKLFKNFLYVFWKFKWTFFILSNRRTFQTILIIMDRLKDKAFIVASKNNEKILRLCWILRDLVHFISRTF